MPIIPKVKGPTNPIQALEPHTRSRSRYMGGLNKLMKFIGGETPGPVFGGEDVQTDPTQEAVGLSGPMGYVAPGRGLMKLLAQVLSETNTAAGGSARGVRGLPLLTGPTGPRGGDYNMLPMMTDIEKTYPKQYKLLLKRLKTPAHGSRDTKEELELFRALENLAP